jgi:hypothetical protein
MVWTSGAGKTRLIRFSGVSVIVGIQFWYALIKESAINRAFSQVNGVLFSGCFGRRKKRQSSASASDGASIGSPDTRKPFAWLILGCVDLVALVSHSPVIFLEPDYRH